MRGTFDLVLLAGVVVAAWTRTPVGALAESFVAAWEGQPGPDVFASFSTSLPSKMESSLHEVATREVLPPTERAPDAALRTAIAAHLGKEAAAELEDADLSDAERVLEEWAIGPEMRNRAIGRARAAGHGNPERYEVHRGFLPGADQRKADRAVSDVLALATTLNLVWPVDPEARITSGFGYRHHPTLKTKKLHEGVDVALPIGTPVHAVAAGEVTRSKEDRVNGKYVKLDHGHGVTSAYCHGSELVVAKNDRVDRGQLIMKSGNTGRSTGPHLHFGVRIRGKAIDPLPFK